MPSSRFAIESELRPEELASISEWCRRSFVDIAEWSQERALVAFVDLAFGRYMDANRKRSHQQTVEAASEHFGFCAETMRTRLKRRRGAARTRSGSR